VLLPGDLYDFRATSLSAAVEFFDCLRKLGDVPVFIAPGNHDYYSSSSFYNADYLLARRQNPIPANVIVFKNFSFESVVPRSCADVCVSGFAYAGFTNSDERPLQARIRRDESKINILLLHGWFEMMKVDISKQTSPFSLEELEMQGFDYAALGHTHSYSEIKSSSGRLLGAYPGSPFGRGLDEEGERYIIVGEAGGGGCDIQRLKIDKRAIRRLDVELRGAGSTEELKRSIESAVEAGGACGDDIVKINLTGRTKAGFEVKLPDDFLRGRFFSVDFDCEELTPDYDIEELCSEKGSTLTVERKFVQLLSERLKAETDPSEKKLLEHALYYGLDALRLKEVRPRYED